MIRASHAGWPFFFIAAWQVILVIMVILTPLQPKKVFRPRINIRNPRHGNCSMRKERRKPPRAWEGPCNRRWTMIRLAVSRYLCLLLLRTKIIKKRGRRFSRVVCCAVAWVRTLSGKKNQDSRSHQIMIQQQSASQTSPSTERKQCQGSFPRRCKRIRRMTSITER